MLGLPSMNLIFNGQWSGMEDGEEAGARFTVGGANPMPKTPRVLLKSIFILFGISKTRL